MKKCTKCNIEKELILFSKSNKSKDGKRSECKECNKNYNSIHKKACQDYNKTYYLKNKLKLNEQNKRYISENKEAIRVLKKKYRQENADKIKLKSLNYYIENKHTLNQKSKNYQQKNRVELNKKRALRKLNRKSEDSLYKLSCNIRRLIQICFKNNGSKKPSKTKEILGCDNIFFRQYIESKFKPWMNWNNYGLFNNEFDYGWDLDHIKPINSAKNEHEILKLNHYTNFQPLCSKYNRQIKKDNYE